ncbi:MAG: hypothetical protein HXS48_00665 [Theionarchaea archaeon]|nr:hypothetical protein [Theionarchaea archaeon]
MIIIWKPFTLHPAWSSTWRIPTSQSIVPLPAQLQRHRHNSSERQWHVEKAVIPWHYHGCTCCNQCSVVQVTRNLKK